MTELHKNKPVGVEDVYTPNGIQNPVMPTENDDIYKIVLTGEAEFSIEQAVLLENLPCFAAKIKDKTKAKVDVSALKEEYSLRNQESQNLCFSKNQLEYIQIHFFLHTML